MTINKDKFDKIIAGIPGEEDKIRKLITEVESKEYNILMMGDLEIKILPSLPRKLSRKVAELGNNPDNEPVDEDAYEIIAEMCVESPYNNPLLWEALDEEYGLVIPAIKRIYAASMETEEQIKTFLGK